MGEGRIDGVSSDLVHANDAMHMYNMQIVITICIKSPESPGSAATRLGTSLETRLLGPRISI